jgi:hypothetical protein
MMHEARSEIVVSAPSDISLMPESVMMEETIDCGSTSKACVWSGKLTSISDLSQRLASLHSPIGVFFFVNEPQPDEPEAMEASSLELTVCRLEFSVMRLIGAGLEPTDGMLLTRGKSSPDVDWLVTFEGLKREDFVWVSKSLKVVTVSYGLNRISPWTSCIDMVTSSIELSCRWRVS